jgi:lipopolysaccharide transport system permease protein
MNAQPSMAPFGGLATAWRKRDLVLQLVKRDVLGRYRGSMLGVGWSLLHPIFMLAVYTFVFSFVFRIRWEGGIGDSKLEFAIVLFCGMIVYTIFAESFTRSPGLIVAQPSFVKKVVFPLEVLPVVTVLAALVHAAISFAVLLALMMAVGRAPAATGLLVPVVLAPYVFFCLGVAWCLSALGVYLRDIGQVAQVLVTALMFLSPLFYPVSALPEALRPFFLLNPLTFPIEATRAVLLFGRAPDALALGAYTAFALASAWAGFAIFQRARRGFADVV